MTENTDAVPSEAFEEWASEEGINNFHFHHCWAAWQAALASPDAMQVPIYQIAFSDDDGGWSDASKQIFDSHPRHMRRVVYVRAPEVANGEFPT